MEIRQNRILVKSRRYNLEPGVMCWEVEDIIHEEKLVKHKFACINRITDCKQEDNVNNRTDPQGISFNSSSFLYSPVKIANQKQN